MGGACGTYGGEEKCIQGFGRGIWGKIKLGKLSLHFRIFRIRDLNPQLVMALIQYSSKMVRFCNCRQHYPRKPTACLNKYLQNLFSRGSQGYN
jgi:hypothetical protein